MLKLPIHPPGQRRGEGLVGGEAGDGGVVMGPKRSEHQSGHDPHPLSIRQGLRLHPVPSAYGLPSAIVYPLNLHDHTRGGTHRVSWIMKEGT